MAASFLSGRLRKTVRECRRVPGLQWVFPGLHFPGSWLIFVPKEVAEAQQAQLAISEVLTLKQGTRTSSLV